jgi:hypothetical protein
MRDLDLGGGQFDLDSKRIWCRMPGRWRLLRRARGSDCVWCKVKHRCCTRIALFTEPLDLACRICRGREREKPEKGRWRVSIVDLVATLTFDDYRVWREACREDVETIKFATGSSDGGLP